MTLIPEEFDKIVAEFLDTQDDAYQVEWWCTEHTIADAVLSALRRHLFAEQLGREARRAQYEALKKEFEP